MINKILLQSIINKYYLGINETVKWKISNGQLEIRFMTPSQDVIGERLNEFSNREEVVEAIMNWLFHNRKYIVELRTGDY